jgi:hypothetical protein
MRRWLRHAALSALALLVEGGPLVRRDADELGFRDTPAQCERMSWRHSDRTFRCERNSVIF